MINILNLDRQTSFSEHISIRHIFHNATRQDLQDLIFILSNQNRSLQSTEMILWLHDHEQTRYNYNN